MDLGKRFILFVAAFFIGTPALAAPAQWRVSEVAGNVEIVENGRARLATRGATLLPGASVRTDARARAVLVRGKEVVMISHATSIRVPGVAETRGGVVQMIADFGRALFRIERGDTPHFGVQTPYLAAVVKGTVFTVTVGAADAAVQVEEGAVEVATLDGGVAEMILPGMVAIVTATDRRAMSIEGNGRRVVRSQEAVGQDRNGSNSARSGKRSESPAAVTQRVPPRAGALREARNGATAARDAAKVAREAAKGAREAAKTARETARAVREQVRAARDVVRGGVPRRGR